jgi:hypothetical protein
MIDARAMELLSRVYTPENRSFDAEKRVLAYRTDGLSKGELADLAGRGLSPGEAVLLEHDDVIARTRAAVKKLALDAICTAFVAGVGGSALRHRQTLISYAWAVNLPATPHTTRPLKSDEAVCDCCQVARRAWVARTYQIWRWANGAAWSESPIRFVLDLEDCDASPGAQPTERDLASFAKLLHFVDKVPKGTTPGRLDKEIARAKILSEKSKYARYGMLQALALVGVLPNDVEPPMLDTFTRFDDHCALSRSVKGAPRSDIVLPLGAWRGGVDWKRVERLFPTAVRTGARATRAPSPRPERPAKRRAR